MRTMQCNAASFKRASLRRRTAGFERRRRQRATRRCIAYLFFACVLLCIHHGCVASLSHAARKLSSDSSIDEVYDIFSNYEILFKTTNNISFMRDSVIFNPDSKPALVITFSTPTQWWNLGESCRVYFSEDGKVLGYYYERPD